MKKALLVALFAFLLILAAGPASARSQAMCGFRCNVEYFDFCIYTGEVRYACYEMQGGCISGGTSNCEGNGF